MNSSMKTFFVIPSLVIPPSAFPSLAVIAGCAALGSSFAAFLVNAAHAPVKKPPGQEMASYYTCIQIQPGDTLWSIAKAYTEGTDIPADAYVRQLKQMNSIGEDTIHAGNYLTVMYQRPQKPKEAVEEE